MSREIKFRAWHVGGSNLGMSIPFGLGSRTTEFTEDGLVYDVVVDFVTMDFMQYTGLKDKNGIEIYEGDIVSDHVGVGVVKYSDKYAGFRVSYGDGMAKWFYDYNLKGERESVEVIGNIHENPELLEK